MLRAAALACLAALLLLGQQAGALRAGPLEPEASLNAEKKRRSRPNIIQVVTDDQVRVSCWGKLPPPTSAS